MSVASRRDRRSSRPSRRPEQSADSDGQLRGRRSAAAGIRRPPGLRRVTRTRIAAVPVVSESVVAGRLGHDGRDPDRADHLWPHPAHPRHRRWSVRDHAVNDTHAVVVTYPVDNTTVDDDHATAVTVLVGRAGAAGWERPASCPGPAPRRAPGASPPCAAHSVDDHVAAHRDYAAARFLRRGGSRLGRGAAGMHR